MRAKWLFLVAAALFSTAALSAQETKLAAANTNAPAKASPAAKAKPNAGKPTQVEPAEGDRAYKANCARCHAAPRKFSERKMATIMQHMRVRANLTARETEAILHYLTQ